MQAAFVIRHLRVALGPFKPRGAAVVAPLQAARLRLPPPPPALQAYKTIHLFDPQTPAARYPAATTFAWTRSSAASVESPFVMQPS